MASKKLRKPVFLKETSSAKLHLEQMKKINPDSLNFEVRSKLNHDIKTVTLGIVGEDAIVYELKNSHMPLYVLHDLLLEYDGYFAQIDFLVITRKINFVIECKNLFGNIEINSKGDFIRSFDNGEQEGIYSPITQNQRHLEIIRQICRETKGNALMRTAYDKLFPSFFRSVVVLANEKTILNDSNAKKEIKEQVIRADSLVSYIKEQEKKSDSLGLNDQQMEESANFFLKRHVERNIDYLLEYEKTTELVDKKQHDISAFGSTTNVRECPQCGASMVVRTNKKGGTMNFGKQFLGCADYPKCKHSMDL